MDRHEPADVKESVEQLQQRDGACDEEQLHVRAAAVAPQRAAAACADGERGKAQHTGGYSALCAAERSLHRGRMRAARVSHSADGCRVT